MENYIENICIDDIYEEIIHKDSKVVKRKLAIFNIENDTNISFEDLNLSVLNVRGEDRVFLFCKEFEPENFKVNDIDDYEYRYNELISELVDIIESCTVKRLNMNQWQLINNKRIIMDVDDSFKTVSFSGTVAKKILMSIHTMSEYYSFTTSLYQAIKNKTNIEINGYQISDNIPF